MHSTIFDFKILFQESNIHKKISDSIFIFIETRFNVIRVANRKDMSLKSQILELDSSGQSNFSSIYEYCSNNKDCLRQTLYDGIYGYLKLFSLEQDIPGIYKPKYLLRDSNYIGILKLYGYEKYGFYSVFSERIVRGTKFKNIVLFDSLVFFRDYLQSKKSAIFDAKILDKYVLLPNINHSTRFGLEYTVKRIEDTKYRDIISSSMKRKTKLYCEKMFSASEIITAEINFSLLTTSFILEKINSRFLIMNIDTENRHVDINGIVPNFGIILELNKEISGLYSESQFLEIERGY